MSAISVIFRTIKLLSKDQKNKLAKLQFLVIGMAIFELLGVASVLPFMNFINATDNEKAKFLSSIPKSITMYMGENVTLYFGISVVLLLLTSSVFSILTVSKLFRFAHKTGAELSQKLYRNYLGMSWMHIREKSSAELNKNITIECQRLTTTILQPLVLLNARIVVACFLIFALGYVDFKVALIASFIYSLSYFYIFYFIKAKVYRNGKSITQISEGRHRILKETFSGHTELIIYKLEDKYIALLNQETNKLATAMANNAIFAQVPRYFMEFVSFGSVVVIILILNQGGTDNIKDIFPTLAFFGVVAMKLLPAFQQIFTSVTHIQGSAAALEAIEDDFIGADLKIAPKNECYERGSDFIVELKGVTFDYGDKASSIKDIHISLEKAKRYGIVGRSGSGKSTLANLIARLIEPKNGKYDTSLNLDDNGEAYDYIGYVPQDIFLKEGTIAENIAYGENNEQISIEKLEKAIEDSGLSDFLATLPQGKFTQVSEDGVRLSGGQRQRIGIARALYRRPALLIFDEATSALDNITEQKIIQTLLALKERNLTVIMIAHRLRTLTECDEIIVMKNGEINAIGTFKDLEQRNEEFQAILRGADK